MTTYSLEKTLEYFKSNTLFSISELNNWLNQNENIYNYCSRNSYNISFENEDDNLLKLCNKYRNEDNITFCDFYEKIKELLELHKYERLTQVELEKFKKIKSNDFEIRNWLINNEKVGCEDLCVFAWEYFDDDEQTRKNKNIKLFQNSYKDIEINIRKNDFESIIKFCEIFNEMYYLKKLYPEGIQKIEEEISKLPIAEK
ncbi:hypothetical protein [Chryseobacterium sp. 5_R23647]|uniref:hypothetical protein n=1 Tax=Chryseobacterium sp. 5_R23647 TaxID=2258964 RepID=UPI000E230EA7|nr:hypothetical protein [Chryseobacterium sp. 5_R23647]REC40201.1 hypothetical protein DRF69_19695 [Chryseobacterium sp. 5_R23647]